MIAELFVASLSSGCCCGWYFQLTERLPLEAVMSADLLQDLTRKYHCIGSAVTLRAACFSAADLLYYSDLKYGRFGNEPFLTISIDAEWMVLIPALVICIYFAPVILWQLKQGLAFWIQL